MKRCRNSSRTCASRPPDFLNRRGTPLLDKNPVVFWKCATLLLGMAVVVLLGVISLRS